MKDFVTPSIIDLDISETAEGVYAGSGAIEGNPSGGTVLSPSSNDGCWKDLNCTFESHCYNDGKSFSVCRVTARHEGDHTSHTLVMHFRTNFTIGSIRNASGTTISIHSDYSFSLTRTDCYNPVYNLGFCFEVLPANVVYEGSSLSAEEKIGKLTSAQMVCTFESYDCY